jgi:hypothetical protein
MKLLSAHITNFRSIKAAKITFDPPCLVLVGINEAGKSNILKALSTLGDFMPTKNDIREPLLNEEPITDASIEFRFSLTKPEAEEVATRAKTVVLSRTDADCAILSGKAFDLNAFVAQRAEGLLEVDIIRNTKFGQYWTIDKGWKLADGWVKPSDTCPEGWMLNADIALQDIKLLFRPDFPEIPGDYLKPGEMEDLADAVGAVVADFVSANLPTVVSWQYSDRNLLPASISIAEFKADPPTCIPLMNMFRLAGHQEIEKSINSVMGESRNRIDNFFSRIATRTTEHFQNVWKEHGAVSFTLRPDGQFLIPGVREANVFNFAQRSDGFKRFVSFLLSVSANVKSGDLTNCLLLVDEPDISLHPSGARFLRDELIRISDSNTVVYSTHSVFMIDREKIERHLIVTKEEEKTKLAVANDENMFSEEVILNALGSSVFEALREQNILFEGWKDKQLFSLATSRFPTGLTKLRASLKSVGICYARGAKNIKSITPLLELAQRDCLIVTDGDQPAKERQKEYQADHGYGMWVRYDELLPSAPVDVTSEDFIKFSVFQPKLVEIQARYSLGEFSDDPTRSVGRLRALDRWLATGGLGKEDRKAVVNEIKSYVSDNLKPSNIESSYYDLLKALAERLDEQQSSDGAAIAS